MIRLQQDNESVENISDQEDIISRFKDFLREQELSENTISSYIIAIRDFFSSHKKVSKDDGIAWRCELQEQGKLPRTINARINAYNKLCEMLNLKDCKCKILRIHRETAISNVISIADYEKLLSCLAADEDWRWYFSIKLLAATGARVSEYVRLQKKDLERGYAEQWTKGKFRRIYIPKRFREEAAAYYTGLRQDDFLVQNYKGKQITTKGVAQRLRQFALRYGIDKKVMHPHAFRHLFAIEFLRETGDLALLSDLLGHANIATTAIYTRQTKEQQQNAVDKAVIW